MTYNADYMSQCSQYIVFHTSKGLLTYIPYLYKELIVNRKT